MLDTVIVGAGPGGMTAAIYARRKGLAIAVIADSLGGQMNKSGRIENYPGFEAISGSQLAQQMRAHLRRLDIEPVLDRVTSVQRTPDGYRVRTGGGRAFEARTVIIATGSRWREIGVPGEKEFANRGVSYCSTCDAPLFAGMDVAVVGGGNTAAEAALELTSYATKVYMIVRSRLKADCILSDRILASDKIQVLTGYTVTRISGGDFVESVEIVSKAGEARTLKVGGVFVDIGMDPNTAFIKDMVKTNSNGEIIVDDCCRTSAQGIFACGDVTSVPQKQIVVAAGEGAKAAMAAYDYLSTRG